MSQRFEVLETLESHQRASLYKARDLQTGTEVHLRRYHGEPDEIAAQSDLLKTLKNLGHPSLEQIQESGTDDEGLFAIVGTPLPKTLTELFKEGPLTEAEFEQLARQILGGLNVLHERGIAHLSLRPEVIRAHRTAGVIELRVGGFGEGFGRQSDTDTAEPAAYRCTAPEQWIGDAVGRRTDVYASGCIFYESLAGKPPYRPDSINGLRAAHLGHDLVPLAKEAPQVRPWVSAWVTQLLDPDMNTRPKDAATALKFYNLRDQNLAVGSAAPLAGLPPGYATPGAPFQSGTLGPARPAPPTNTGMVPMTRVVMPVSASATSAFQPVELAHKTARIIPQPGPRLPQRSAVAQVPLTPTPPPRPKTKPMIIGGSIAIVVAAIALLLLSPAKPVMAPVAERLAKRLPVTHGVLLHLDAGRHDTLETTITNRVRRWTDTEVKTRYAAPPAPDNGPTVSAGGLNELPILNFGPYKAEQWLEFKNADGKTNHLTNIRTVFWVMKGAGFLLCDDQTTDFHRGGQEGSPDAGIIGAPAADAVKKGKLRVNGTVVKTVDTPLPTSFALISLVTADNAKASRLCRDRDGHDRIGGQEIAEIVIYDHALTDDEVRQVEMYLRTKWLSP